jgi:uncharacterized membrane protein
MSLIVRHEVCSDGMSDTRYPFSAIAIISGHNVIAGCCRRGGPRESDETQKNCHPGS